MNVERLVDRLTARPGVSLLVAVLLSVGMFWYGSGIQVRSDMEDLFPDSTPHVQRAKRARAILKSTSELLVVVGSPHSELNRRLVDELGVAFARHTALVTRVEVKRDTAFFEKNALLYMPLKDVRELRDEVAAAIGKATSKASDEEEDWDVDGDDEASSSETPKAGEASNIPSEEELRQRYGADKVREYFASPDGQVYGIKVYPSFKPAETGKTRALNERLERDIETIVGPHRSEFAVVTTMDGDYAHVTAAVNQLKSESLLALLVALGGIALVLIAYFRRLRAVVVTLLPLAVGILGTFFLARLFIGYLNLITAFIFSILVGLGIDFVIHAAARVDEEHCGGVTLHEAMNRALKRLGAAMVAAAVTTAAAFFALAVFDFRGFSQFGLLAGLGVLVSLCAVYSVFPATALAFHRLRPRRASPPRQRSDASLRHTQPTKVARRLAWLTLIVVGLAALFAGFGLGDLRFEADMRKLRAKKSVKAETEQSRLRARYFKDVETRTTSPALFITDSLEQTRKLHRQLEARLEQEPLLRDVRSIFSFVPDEQPPKYRLVNDIKRIIDNKYEILEGQQRRDADRLRKYLNPKPFDAEGLPSWLRDRFTDREGTLGRYVLMYVNGVKSDGAHVVKIVDRVGSVTLDDGSGTYHATASWMMIGEAYSVVKREGPIAVGLAAAVVLLFLIGHLRRPASVLLVFLPLVVGFIIFLGVLVAAEIPLNIFNIVVLPTIFGIGVDTAIHLVHRLRQGGSVGHVIQKTGGAAAISSLTTAVGFYALTLVSNQGLVSIGWVAVVGIAVCYAVCVSCISAVATLWPYSDEQTG